MEQIPGWFYILLLLTAIVCGVMVQVAKYGWRSRGWTWFFALLGSGAVLTLMILYLTG